MDHATLSKGYYDRRAILDELGGMEVPGGSIAALRWDDISKDCLPVFLYKCATPKGVIASNRMQLDHLRKTDHEFNRELYIVEISRLMKHSNLEYCEDTIEKDRKFRHKKKKLLSNTKKAIMKDIVQSLNKTRTAAEIAAQYGTSAFNINQIASRLRKEYNFNIPGARGFDEFGAFASELAKESPELIRKPLAKGQPATAVISKLPLRANAGH